MNKEEAVVVLREWRYPNILLLGKTCTGKSTFAELLVSDYNYGRVELDVIITGTVIPQFALKDEGLVFREIYKKRSQPELTELFLRAVRDESTQIRRSGKSVVFEGGVVNTDTIRDLIEQNGDTKILYLHPVDIESYIENITSRFMLSDNDNNAGLPITFWELLSKDDFEKFCRDRQVTKSISDAIRHYASDSQKESQRRLEVLGAEFNDVVTIDV